MTITEKKNAWPVAISVNVLNGQGSVWFDADVPYENLSGNKVPKRTNKEAFNKYRNEVTVYQNLLLDRSAHSAFIYADVSINYKEYLTSIFDVTVTVELKVLNTKANKYNTVYKGIQTKQINISSKLYNPTDIFKDKKEEYAKTVYSDVFGRSKLYKERYNRYKNNSLVTINNNSSHNTDRTATNKSVQKANINATKISFLLNCGFDFSVDVQHTNNDKKYMFLTFPMNLGIRINNLFSLYLEAIPIVSVTSTNIYHNGQKVNPTIEYNTTLFGLGIGLKYSIVDFNLSCGMQLDTSLYAYIYPRIQIFLYMSNIISLSYNIGFRYRFTCGIPEITNGVMFTVVL